MRKKRIKENEEKRIRKKRKKEKKEKRIIKVCCVPLDDDNENME